MMPLLHSVKQWVRTLRNERLYRREEVDLPVKVQVTDQKEAVDARIKNWSSSGVLVLLDHPLPVHSNVDLEFSVGSSIIRLRGQVTRHQGVDAMGVMFTDFTESGLTILRQFLAQQKLS
jgi:hypothetical protein